MPHPSSTNFASTPKKIHFIGIGGIGMSGLASLCLHKGVKVQGSNAGKNASTEKLSSQGVPVFYEHKSGYLDPEVNLVVTSTAIHENNPEWLEAKSKGIPIVHRSTLLQWCVAAQKTLAVSGTHGKTTTTSLLGHVLVSAGLDPLIITGGVMGGYESTIYPGQGDFAVVEADESDKSHVNFQTLMGAIVTNIEAEHMDHYKGSFSLLCDSFVRFLSLSSEFGIVCGDDLVIQKIVPLLPKAPKVWTYGFSESCAIRAHNVRQTAQGLTFDVESPIHSWSNIPTRLWGHHNILNALSVITAAQLLGIQEEAVVHALGSFQGVNRRLTVKGHLKGTTIIDDYAHHPTEIKAVLQALRQKGYQKVLAVCQPHRYTRLRDSMELFTECFDQANKVVLFPVYSAGEAPLQDINSHTLATHLRQKGLDVVLCDQWEDSHAMVSDLISCGDYDVAVCMGAGTITELATHLPERV